MGKQRKNIGKFSAPIVDEPKPVEEKKEPPEISVDMGTPRSGFTVLSSITADDRLSLPTFSVVGSIREIRDTPTDRDIWTPTPPEVARAEMRYGDIHLRAGSPIRCSFVERYYDAATMRTQVRAEFIVDNARVPRTRGEGIMIASSDIITRALATVIEGRAEVGCSTPAPPKKSSRLPDFLLGYGLCLLSVASLLPTYAAVAAMVTGLACFSFGAFNLFFKK